jgi:hypothetical protein
VGQAKQVIRVETGCEKPELAMAASGNYILPLML